jgi:hypothetical protein
MVIISLDKRNLNDRVCNRNITCFCRDTGLRVLWTRVDLVLNFMPAHHLWRRPFFQVGKCLIFAIAGRSASDGRRPIVNPKHQREE